MARPAKYSPEQKAAAKAAAVDHVQNLADFEAAKEQAEIAAAGAIQALCEAVGQSGPIKLELKGGTRVVEFRLVRKANPPRYTMHDWVAPVPA